MKSRSCPSPHAEWSISCPTEPSFAIPCSWDPQGPQPPVTWWSPALPRMAEYQRDNRKWWMNSLFWFACVCMAFALPFKNRYVFNKQSISSHKFSCQATSFLTVTLLMSFLWVPSTGRILTSWNESREWPKRWIGDEASLLCGKSQRTGIAQLGKEKASGWPNCSLPVSEGG